MNQVQVAEHVETINVKDVEVVHGHAERGAESAEFHKNVSKLKGDGFGYCFATYFLTGKKVTENLQVHHFLAEWSEGSETVDFDKLRRLTELFDPYGYGKSMKDVPMESVDDIRNMLVLSQQFHTGVNKTANNATGIHNLVFPFWIALLNCKDEKCPIPLAGETLEDVEKRLA